MIKLCEINKLYAGGAGLKNLSLHIEKGTFVSIIGPSGAGKTTLLNCINGMVSTDSGTVFIGGEDFTHAGTSKKKQMKQKIGMIFQDFCLVPTASVLQNVINARLFEYPLWRVLTGCFGHQITAEAKMWIGMVGLEKQCEQRASLLSGGEKQRTAIARSLMQHCHILLADEPVASLDPVHAKEVLQLMRKMQQEENLTIVMNSHHVLQAKSVSDRIIGLKDGQIVFDGPAESLNDAALQLIYGKEQA